jgi:bifunctional non-homologous end joining protein LigD
MTATPRRRSRPASPPDWVRPQLATLADEPPRGDDWLHEIKYDGYRLLARVDDGGQVRLLTRSHKDWTERFPAVVAAFAVVGLGPALLDGEVAVELEGGVTDFQALQNVLRQPGRGTLRFYLFDVLFLDGEDLSGLPLIQRKHRLEAMLRSITSREASAVLRYSDHVSGRGPAFFREACGHGLEGIISKRAAAPYRPGRGTDWLKVKCVREQEFVVGGFTEPAGSRSGLGALHVGAYDEAGRLVYSGKVGTGYTDAVLRDLRARLAPLERERSPFIDPPRGAAVRGTHWVEPEMVVQVRFTEMTGDGRLRHPSYQGLREDKPAGEVRLEAPRPTASLASGQEKGGTMAKNARSTGSRGTGAGGAGAATEVAGVRLTSPDKVMYPDQGVTKLDLARHYERVADLMLPLVSGRPLTLVRCPSGRHGQCFFQKHMDETAPPAVRRVQVEERDGPEWYGTVDSVEGLISLVQLGVLEFHASNARRDRLGRPDRFLVDLDPDDDLEWSDVVGAAFDVHDLLAELGLRSFVKTTGGKGLHVVVPLVRRSGWEDVKAFSHAVVSLLAAAAPDRYTTVMSKKKRRGRIFLDYLRNSEGATAVEAYSTRARPGAPVAVPIAWEELHDGVRADTFTVETLPQRLTDLETDPWEELGAVRQSITAPMRRKVGLQ